MKGQLLICCCVELGSELKVKRAGVEVGRGIIHAPIDTRKSIPIGSKKILGLVSSVLFLQANFFAFGYVQRLSNFGK